MPRQNLVVLNEKSVVDYCADVVFLRQKFRPETFSRAACSDKRENRDPCKQRKNIVKNFHYFKYTLKVRRRASRF